jgi:hypothetical protein
MRFKTVLSFSTLAAFVATLAIGCSQGEEIRLAPAPPVELGKGEPLPKDTKKGGGSSSSGNFKGDPFADPLQKK